MAEKMTLPASTDSLGVSGIPNTSRICMAADTNTTSNALFDTAKVYPSLLHYTVAGMPALPQIEVAAYNPADRA